MAATQTIFDFREEWKTPIIFSSALHVGVVVASIIYGAFFMPRGSGWGSATPSSGNVVNATLVSSALPLPNRPVTPESVLATESKGLSKPEESKRQPDPEAIAIPDKAAEKNKAKKPEPKPATKTVAKPPEEASNVIPYGEGGPAAMNYTMVRTDMGTGGLSVGEDGSFGNRYAWYVEAVRRKVSDNWFKYEVDPNISAAQRVYITFDITRSGQPTNIQISQSSGVPTLDISARRALQRIDTFGPLPGDYSGSRVSVEFWFDYKR